MALGDHESAFLCDVRARHKPRRATRWMRARATLVTPPHLCGAQCYPAFTPGLCFPPPLKQRTFRSTVSDARKKLSMPLRRRPRRAESYAGRA